MEKHPEQKEEMSEIKKILTSEIPEIVVHGDRFTEHEKDQIESEREKKGISQESLSASNPEGKEQVKLQTDLDGRAALYLLDLAGVKYNKLTFVKKSDWIPGSLNIDTGERPGFSIEKDGTIFFDHHGKERAKEGETTSATSLVYNTLIENGLIEKSEWLDNLVTFVTGLDNADYPINRKSFEHDWAKSLYGLHKILPFETMVECFKKGKTAEKPFTDEEMENDSVDTINGKNKPLKEICESQQKMVNSNIKEIKDSDRLMIKSGIKNFVDGELKKVLINHPTITKRQDGSDKITNKLNLGFTATRALGYTSYIILNEENGGFFITSKNTLNETYEKILKEFPEAKLIRGTMIIQNDTGEKINQENFLRTLNLLESKKK